MLLKLCFPVSYWWCRWERSYNCKGIRYQIWSAKQENTHWFNERWNVAICIQFFMVNSTADGNFFHTILLIFMPAMLLSLHFHQLYTCLISSTCQYTTISLWSSITGCDLTCAPCINNCMNITMLTLKSVQWHSRLEESGNVAVLLCLSCKLAAITIGY